MSDGPKLVKFPTKMTSETVNELLERVKALNLPSVLILSQLHDGTVKFFESELMTVGESNWLCDAYKFHLQTSSMDD